LGGKAEDWRADWRRTTNRRLSASICRELECGYVAGLEVAWIPSNPIKSIEVMASRIPPVANCHVTGHETLEAIQLLLLVVLCDFSG
jgi:hypothetical protein